MSESPAAEAPSLEEARRWVGHRVDEIGGSGIGKVHGFFVDADGGGPSWVIAKLGRFRSALVAIPFGDCAAGVGRVWIAHQRGAIRAAPIVDPSRPLLREHELTICAHYGIGEHMGRAAEVVGRPAGSVTSRPPGS